VSRTTANLNGEVTPNKVGTVYWFEYGKTANLGNTTSFVSVGEGSTKIPTSVSVSNLDADTTYYFRINAQNQFGTVNGSILNFKTLGPPSAAAPSVTTRNVSDITSSKATLHGAVNPNRAETAYWFEYSSDSLLGAVLIRTTPRVSLASGSSQVSVEADVSGLSSSTTYYFRIVAENSVGTVRGERESFKTK
jgi:phosphodiesterase/alkaline phosphatase D-like protein